jgi:hypothetical protein
LYRHQFHGYLVAARAGNRRPIAGPAIIATAAATGAEGDYCDAEQQWPGHRGK